MNKITINGVEVFPFSSREQLMDYVDKNKSILIAINAEKVMNATDQTRAIINSNIGYCDGVGAVWALRQKGAKNVEKIPGCELWLDIINRYHNDKSFYLIGGKQEVIDATVKKLKQDFPGLNLVGYRNGYLKSDDERNALIDDVAQKKPDVVFVAMGSPKQEILMTDMMKVHPAIYQGLGGSFDVYTGRVKRAPLWWQKHNIEFLYRFLKQPQRYRREYYRLKFLAWMLMGKFKKQ